MKTNKINILRIKSIIQVLRQCITKSNSKIPFLSDSLLENVFYKYTSSIERYVQINGKKYSVKLFKQLHKVAECIATGRTFPPMSFVRSDPRGVPRILKPLVKLLGSEDQNHKRFALTITRLYTSIYCDVEFDETPITGESESSMSDIQKKEFSDWVSISQFLPRERLRSPNNEPVDLKFSTANGPNGPASLTFHLDSLALENNSHIKYWFNELLSTMDFEWLEQYRINCLNYSGTIVPKLGRISLISEGGGKTRTIAIGNFWIQHALRPIHDNVMNRLSKIITDGTFNQDDQAQRIVQESQGKPTYCYDLSNATDRFPIYLQSIILKKIFQDDLAEAWEHIMVDVPYSYKDKEYKWKVGQPLGLLSSWAVFSLTHHSVVRYCAFKEGFNNFDDYALLGDDIVIWNQKVANRYYDFMKINGVNINLQKSVVSTCDPHLVEYAKRLYYKGVEISGLSFDIMVSGLKPHGFVQFYHYCLTRGWNLTGHFLFPGFSNKWENLLKFIINVTVVGLGALQRANLLSPDLIHRIKKEYFFFRLESINNKVSTSWEDIMKEYSITDLLRSWGFTGNEQLLGRELTALDYHPIITMCIQKHELLEKLMFQLYRWNASFGSSDGELPPLHEVEYVPNTSTCSFFGDRKFMRSTKMSKLMCQVFKKVKEEIPPYLYEDIQISVSDIHEIYVKRGLKSHTGNMVSEKKTS